MARFLSSAAFVLSLSCLVFGVTGCGGPSSPDSAATPTSGGPDNHAHDDHGHDHAGHDHGEDDHSHDGHDHPEHGPNGGHMVNLSGGAHAEWAHDDDKELITVYPENVASVTGVQMRTLIQDEATAYDFTKADDDGLTVYTLTSPELLTAIKMGDAVKTELVIMTGDGEASGKVVHHQH